MDTIALTMKEQQRVAVIERVFRREATMAEGMLPQVDGSPHDWLEGRGHGRWWAGPWRKEIPFSDRRSSPHIAQAASSLPIAGRYEIPVACRAGSPAAKPASGRFGLTVFERGHYTLTP